MSAPRPFLYMEGLTTMTAQVVPLSSLPWYSRWYWRARPRFFDRFAGPRW